MEQVKVNLGSGPNPIDGYDNVDIKDGRNVYPLDYADNSIDEIRASHILEHFGAKEVEAVLLHWVGKLKPRGILKVAVPDFAKIVEEYRSGDSATMSHLVGGQLDEYDLHKYLFDRDSLTKMMIKAGLISITSWNGNGQDCSGFDVSLNLQGRRVTAETPIGKILDKIAKRRGNKYSQFGEDGVTEAIFEKIGIKNKWVLEVGASDGMLFSNSRQWVEQGWNAILIESEKLAYDRLVENCKNYPFVRTVYGELGRDFNLDEILAEYKAPTDLDLMIIDIDGQDYHVWNAMLSYAPRVIIAEYDPKADTEYIPPLRSPSDTHNLKQAGQTAMVRLGASKGYCACIASAVNVIMIHNSVNVEIDEEPESVTDTEPVADKFHSETTKPAVIDTPKEAAEASHLVADSKGIVTVSHKVTAIMSAPRIGFVNNLMLCAKVLVPLSIEVRIGYGVFWGQILSRMIQEQIEAGIEWIITLDYDSYYQREHLLTLMRLMAEYPKADALMPIQLKREEDRVLAGVDDSAKANCEYDANCDLIEIDTGHFGMTFFRLDAFKKLKKPWFQSIPDENGDWGEGRQDEDIFFWKNWRRSGLTAYLTPQVSIGHMQLMITWPGKFERDSKPIHQYLSSVDKEGIPKHCRVSEEFIPTHVTQKQN